MVGGTLLHIATIKSIIDERIEQFSVEHFICDRNVCHIFPMILDQGVSLVILEGG